MTYIELKALSLSALIEKKKENAILLKKLKLSHAVSPIENPMKIKTIRRLIAKINTLLQEKKK